MSFLAYSLSVSFIFSIPTWAKWSFCRKKIDFSFACHNELFSSQKIIGNIHPVGRPFIQALTIPPSSMLRMNFHGQFFFRSLSHPKVTLDEKVFIAYHTRSEKMLKWCGLSTYTERWKTPPKIWCGCLSSLMHRSIYVWHSPYKEM